MNLHRAIDAHGDWQTTWLRFYFLAEIAADCYGQKTGHGHRIESIEVNFKEWLFCKPARVAR